MSKLDGFSGPSNTSRSPLADAERTINLYVEVSDAGTPRVRSVMYGTPGLRPFVNLGGGPVRQVFGQDGRAFAVVANRFYEIFATHTAIQWGTVANDQAPATISTNGTAGHQLFIVSGGHGYIFDLITSVFVEITTEDFPVPVVMGGFCDGYFIVLKGQSNQFNISELEDGLSWDGLDVAQVSESSNQLLAMAIDHREITLLGSRTTEIWRDVGDASFPFAPVGGTLIEYGIAAPWSIAKLDNTILWVGQDERGQGFVVKLSGYQPVRISTFAVEAALRTEALSQAIAWSYQEAGHSFYLLYIPGAETTWVYDVSQNLWHERAGWDPITETWMPHPGRCHAFIFGVHLVGDRASGLVYEQSLDFYDEQVA